jgi:hypothetical protein
LDYRANECFYQRQEASQQWAATIACEKSRNLFNYDKLPYACEHAASAAIGGTIDTPDLRKAEHDPNIVQ